MRAPEFSPSSRLFALSCVFLLSLCLSGCGVDLAAPAPTQSLHSLSGLAHGGPNPVVGATVNLYATTSGGYGAAATLLSTAVTDTNGFFTFVAPATCTAGQQAYVTVYGGNPGSGLNANYLLMAALGPCSTISSATSIWVDEATTVAAAYALRPFISITGTTVNVGAPANNNAATGTCTTVAGATTGCVAAGLTHAFANALNLTNSVSIAGVAPLGTAYSVTPSNSTGSVPQALINSLADSVEACVNSPGGATGDGSNCGALFGAATPPVTGATAPTNTLQALLDIAQYPALTPANVTGLYNLASSTSFYQPALTTAPADFSLAISYAGVNTPGTVGSISVNPGGSGYTSVPTVTFTGGGTPTTTAAATAELGVSSITVTGGGAGSCTTPVVKFTGGGGNYASATATVTAGVITAVTVNTPGNGYTTVPTISFTGTGCTGATATASLGVVAVVLTNPGAGYTSAPAVAVSGGNGSGTVLTATDGVTALSAPFVLTLDANDTVYVDSQNVAAANGANSFLSALASNGTSLYTTLPNTTFTSPRGGGTDTLGNVWVSFNSTVAGFYGIECFVASSGATCPGSTFTQTTTNVKSNIFTLAIDRSNNIWWSLNGTANQNLVELSQASSYATYVAFAHPTIYTAGPHTIAFDANQNVWTANFYPPTANSSVGIFPNTGTAAAPVYGGTAITVPITGSSANALALDASGNAWVPSANGYTGSTLNTTTSGLYLVNPTYSTSNPPTVASAAVSAGSPIVDNALSPMYNSVDGSGNSWIPDNQSSTLVQYVPATGVTTSFSPCYAPSGAQTCTTKIFSQPAKTVEDSTGSVWISSVMNNTVVQLIGTASPTWPQLSLGAPGVMPQ
jgi:hypothetical protein